MFELETAAEPGRDTGVLLESLDPMLLDRRRSQDRDWLFGVVALEMFPSSIIPL